MDMETPKIKLCCRKPMCIKFTKGVMQVPLGDIDGHGHLHLMQETNLNKT